MNSTKDFTVLSVLSAIGLWFVLELHLSHTPSIGVSRVNGSGNSTLLTSVCMHAQPRTHAHTHTKNVPTHFSVVCKCFLSPLSSQVSLATPRYIDEAPASKQLPSLFQQLIDSSLSREELAVSSGTASQTHPSSTPWPLSFNGVGHLKKNSVPISSSSGLASQCSHWRVLPTTCNGFEVPQFLFTDSFSCGLNELCTSYYCPLPFFVLKKNTQKCWKLTSVFYRYFYLFKEYGQWKKHGLIKCQINRELHKIPTTTSNRKTALCTPCFHNARDIRRILITLIYFFHS